MLVQRSFSFGQDALDQAIMLLCWSHVSDSRMKMLGVVPAEVILHTLLDPVFLFVLEPAGVVVRALERAEERLDEGIVIGGFRPAEGMRQSQLREHLPNVLGFHLRTPVVHHHGLVLLFGFQQVFTQDGDG